MCFYYDETVECQIIKRVKARKDHRCDCCYGVTIHRGDTYQHQSGIFTGSPFRERTCRRCLYDISRIVDHELSEDCAWHTAWPANDDVSDYLNNSGMGRTEVENVPVEFDYWKWYERTAEAYRQKMALKYPRSRWAESQAVQH